MKTKTHFAFRVDIWDTGDSIVEHVAGVDDFEVAEATYRAAVARWSLIPPISRLRSNGVETSQTLAAPDHDYRSSSSSILPCSPRKVLHDAPSRTTEN
jgi:hypothetical protein